MGTIERLSNGSCRASLNCSETLTNLLHTPPAESWDSRNRQRGQLNQFASTGRCFGSVPFDSPARGLRGLRQKDGEWSATPTLGDGRSPPDSTAMLVDDLPADPQS